MLGFNYGVNTNVSINTYETMFNNCADYLKAIDNVFIDNTLFDKLNQREYLRLLKEMNEISTVITSSEFEIYCEHMKANDITISQFIDYIYNRSENLKVDEKVQDAIIEAIREMYPNITEIEINKILYRINL